MSSFIKLVTGADTSPVTLVDALRRLRALENEADMVWSYVQAATAMVEDYCGRSLVSKTYDLMLSGWPEGRIIELRRSPLVSVTHVKYYDESNTLQTWGSSNYLVHTARLPGAVEIVADVDVPAVADRADAIEIRFVAGHGTKASSMPQDLTAAILMLAHYWYDERKPVAAQAMTELPLSVRHLLRAARVDSQLPIP